jgi:hypothetical protein
MGKRTRDRHTNRGSEHGFEEGGQRHDPRQPQAVRRRCYRGRHDVAGADASRDDARSGAINLTTLVVGVVVFWA